MIRAVYLLGIRYISKYGLITRTCCRKRLLLPEKFAHKITVEISQTASSRLVAAVFVYVSPCPQTWNMESGEELTFFSEWQQIVSSVFVCEHVLSVTSRGREGGIYPPSAPVAGHRCRRVMDPRAGPLFDWLHSEPFISNGPVCCSVMDTNAPRPPLPLSAWEGDACPDRSPSLTPSYHFM